MIWDRNQKAINLFVSTVYRTGKHYDKEKLQQDLREADFQPERDLRVPNSVSEWELCLRVSEDTAKRRRELDLKRVEEQRAQDQLSETIAQRANELLGRSPQETQGNS